MPVAEMPEDKRQYYSKDCNKSPELAQQVPTP
jgi:hypothetical protein